MLDKILSNTTIMEYIKLNKYLTKIISDYVDYSPLLLYELSNENRYKQYFDITKYSLLDIIVKLCEFGHNGIVITNHEMFLIKSWFDEEMKIIKIYYNMNIKIPKHLYISNPILTLIMFHLI